MYKTFDFEAALDRCDGDRDLLKELIQMFFSDYSQSLEQLSSAVQDNNSLGVDRGAHAFKSALGNLGAMKAFESARKLEFAGKNQDKASFQDLFTEFKNEVEAFRAEGMKFS